jgi:hypothetical protein
MNNNEKNQCEHKYIVGYSYRLPQPFVSSLPCDKCGCRIRLSLPWLITYWCAEIIGFIVAFSMASSIHVKFLGGTFIVSFLTLIICICILHLIIRLIFRYGKWVEVE